MDDDVWLERVCGLDVHKEMIVACVRIVDEKRMVSREVRTFSAHKQGLEQLRLWLTDSAVQAIAMEGTGVYWRPVYAALELNSPRWMLIVGNAQHIKNVPGRKTDVKDAEWIAHLVGCGLIRPSFIPPVAQRELRDVTRLRAAWVADQARDRNRILKILQLAGIKLDGVASDAFGKTGKLVLKALVEGNATPSEMAQFAKGRMRSKIDALALALESPLGQVHRKMLAIALARLEQTESHLRTYDELIDELLAPYASQMKLLVTIPGVERIVGATIIAELGPDMSVFPSEAHAASWAGVAPGNNESAGKRRNGTTSKGNPNLRTALCLAGNAASRKKDSYLRDKFFRLKARRGHGRAVMAIAHKILIAAYNILKRNVPYTDLGDDYLDKRDKTRVVASLLSRLRALGADVSAVRFATPPPLGS